MKYVYFDNAATSFPKAPGVAESISDYILNVGTNVNRGAYSSSYEVENIVYETREMLCELFNYNKPENVIFTKNITESMNVLIKGLLKENDHVIVSSMEHNAVMRPLNSFNGKIEYTKVLCNELGELNISDIEKAIKKNTKAIIMTHASNVCGTILDLEKVGQVCKKYNLFFIIDSAQTAGFLNLDFQNLNADALAFTGHKSLLGPQGIGGFIVNDRINDELSTLIEGGTGSLSDTEVQPNYMPDKFEAGTLNIPGIYGLNTSLKYLLKHIDDISNKELQLFNRFLEGVLNIDNIKIIGKKTSENRTGVLSIDFINHDNGLVSHALSKDYGIMTRSGLHCAPSAHKTLGTFPHGTVRFSISHFTSTEEINYTIDCIHKIVSKTY